MRVVLGVVGILMLVACAGRSVDREDGSGEPEPRPVTPRPNDVIGGAGTAGVAGSGAGTGFPGGAGGAGTGYAAGAGGAPGVVTCEFPPVEVELASWSDPAEPDDLEAELDRIDAAIVGDWYGVVTLQTDPPYEVSASFRADGGYSARCEKATPGCCVAFNYGTDDDTELKHYELFGIDRRGAYGEIDIAFRDGSTYYPPAWQGELRSVQIDATGDRLRFDFYQSDMYPPIEFDLERVSAPE